MGALLLIAATALGGGPGEATFLAPKPAVVGTPWQVTVSVKGGTKSAWIDVRTRSAREVRVRRARRTGTGSGTFRASFTFPFAATWRLDARLGSRWTTLGAVRVAPRPVAIPGAAVFTICANRALPYPQYGLSLGLGSLWVACRDKGTLQRIDPATGTRTATVGPVSGDLYAIAAGGGAVWATQRGPSALRIDIGSGALRTPLPVGESAYVFFAAGSVWAADDLNKTLLRFDPDTGRSATLSVGDGTSALVTDGRRAWITNHRDATLERIDLATNTVKRLSKLPGDAPERMVSLAGSLWVTGRGTDLLRVDPDTGAVLATIEVGAGAIDLQQAGGRVWVFAPSAADDRRGMPFAQRLLEVDPDSNRIVRTIRTRGQVVVNGLASDGTSVWAADTTNGRLYRIMRSS